MSGYSVNHVTITGNLVSDPELRSLPSGTSVCKCRIGHNERRKNTAGEWIDVPHFFDVTVWGALGERLANQTSKGEKVLFEGRLNFREWEGPEGQKRSAVDIVANTAIRIPRDDRSPTDEHIDASAPGDDDIPF